jgi:hypothetical protein
VSLFEPTRPLQAADAARAGVFETEGSSTTDDHLRSDRQSTSAAGTVSSFVTTASPRNLPDHRVPETAPLPEPETMPHPDPYGDALRGRWHEPPKPEPRASTVPRTVLAELQVHSSEQPASLVEKLTPLPFPPERARPGVRARQASQAHAQPQASQRPFDDSQIHAVTEANLPESTAALRTRRLQVQGKRVAQHDATDTRPPVEALFPAPDGLGAPVRTVRNESPDRTGASEPELHAVTSPPDPVPSVARADTSAPTPAILVPRLPEQPPVQLPMQIGQGSIAKPVEPIVHVTIGRVEIRAVPAPAVPKRSSSPKPALSLSDYLTRRNGGGA